jgi:valyl-tRNA synthetase
VKPKIKEKRWNQELEKKIRGKWEKERLFIFDSKTKKKIFSIDTPPPYPSGRPWHIGAVAHYSQIDMIARTARLLGSEVFFPMGIDRNGLPVELYTEKKYNVSMHEMPREKFIELCRHALDDLEVEMSDIMKFIGMSCDFKNYYRTDSEEYRKLTQATFIELWKRGLIYESTRPNNYCVDCKTTIADAEIDYQEIETELVYIGFEVRETGETIMIATTRPELLCACQAVIVNPNDARYMNLHGKHVTIPLYDREVQIHANSYAKPEFGSGIVMLCSYGDYSDVRLFRELGLAEIVAVDVNGRLTKSAGRYADLPIKKARQAIVEDLQNLGFIRKREKIMHRTPVCDRSATPIEIIPMKEFYLKQLDFVPAIKKLVKKIKFYPVQHRQILTDWLNAITIDWPISRRRFYGTEIPVWYCKKCGKAFVPEPGEYYQPWKQQPRCTCCGGKEFAGEDRTFDTWMDSSISPLFISRCKRNEKLFKKLYPNTIRTQGKDIIRTWLYYTLLRCYQLTGNPAFHNVWIMGYSVDEKGEKMSKSKGNIIDPLPLLNKYGADAFRFWNAAETSLGSDFRCSEERIASASKFLTKLWNIARFISSFPQVKARPTKTDTWILGELDNLVNDCMKGYEGFNFFIPSNKIREFTWNLFASHYLEMAKTRAYGTGFTKQEQKSAWFTLHTCLKTIIQLLSPITPFITDHLWTGLYGKRVDEFPSKGVKNRMTKLTQKLVKFNSSVWDMKKQKGLSLKDPVKMKIPKQLKPFEKDLKIMHNLI